MQTVATSFEKLEVLLMGVNFIAGVISLLYVLRQNSDTTSLVNAAETSAQHLASSKSNIERALGQSRHQVDDAKSQMQTLFRPNLFVAFENPYKDGGRRIFLTVHNVGNATATNIRIEFEPELERCNEHFSLEHLHALLDSIPSLPPGQRIGHAFDYVLDIKESEKKPPDEYSVEIAYFEAEGKISYRAKQQLSMKFFFPGNRLWRFVEKTEPIEWKKTPAE
ncbi:MAG: hypothetical protein ABL984_03330 [Pyrinomonadaceae bacterium]